MFAMTWKQWRQVIAGLMGAAPKREKKAATGREPRRYALLHTGRNSPGIDGPNNFVEALTKSEARAVFKERLGIKRGRLPLCYDVLDTAPKAAA